MEFCENFTYEDNFNNTFFDKILPHTTAVATEFRGKGNTISRESKTKLDFVSLTLILRVYMLIFISRKGHKGNDDEDEDEDEDENLLLTTLRTLVVTKFATTPAQA